MKGFASEPRCLYRFMSAFVKASAMALQAEPAVNSMIDGTDQVFFDYSDIGVAVATPKGLVVPVLRNCEEMGFKGASV